MRGIRGVLISAATLYFAAALGQALSPWTLLGGRADFVVAAVCVLCLFASPSGGATIGFFGGWIYACLDGANMWQYVATRTVAGCLVAYAAAGGIERNYFSAFLAGVFGLLIAQIAYMFLAPPGSVSQFLGDTIRTAVYNGVLAMLLYASLNRILGPRR